MEIFEQWLDADDDFDPENDRHPERAEADEATMARILGIGSRHVRRLTRGGILHRLPNGRYNRLDALDAYVAHVSKPAAQSAGMRQRQAELIQRRLGREARELILLADALATLSMIGNAFDDALIEVSELAGEDHDETERARRREIARQASERLGAKIGVEVEELRTGRAAEDE